MQTIMVLSDGETYSDVSGCKIVAVPDWYTPEDIEAYLENVKGAGTVGVIKVWA